MSPIKDIIGEQIKEIKLVFAPLFKKTTKKTIVDTLSLLYMVIGGRRAYYDDSDVGGFLALPQGYRDELIKVCEKFHFAITFSHEGRWLVVDTTKELPANWQSRLSHKTLGSMLDFPCSHKTLDMPTKEKLYVAVNITTEFDKDTLLIGFVCFPTEKQKIMKWFESRKPYLEAMRPFFKKYSYELKMEKLEGNKFVPV